MLDIIQKMNLKSLLSNYVKVVIPDVQRDYVMGSGGDKLISLFQSLYSTQKSNISFNFSCIMGFIDEDTNTFYVYDGQQRLATLVYLCAYLNKEQGNKENFKKFQFSYREEANKFLNSLLLNKQAKPNIVDFTTFSLNNLIEQLKTQDYFKDIYTYSSFENQISFHFLYEQVEFEIVIVNKATDAEQFFMDLNDGLDLKSYEIFKAELFHIAQRIYENKFKDFALSIDNKWLKFFLPYKTEEHCEEEIEIAFVQFCFRMIWIEEKGTDEGYVKNSLDWFEAKHLERLEKIMNNIINLKMDNKDISCVNYSFGNRTDRKWNRSVNNVEGIYWNLADNNYSTMLNAFLKGFCIEGNKSSVKKDAVIWAYISNCENDAEILSPYLRFIKKLLNHNLIENNNAYYDCNRTMWYTKYSAYGIPTYYLETENFPNLNYQDKTDYIYSVIHLNQSFNGKFDINIFDTEDEILGLVLETEKQKDSSNQKEEIVYFENLPYINGLVDNLLDNQSKLITNYNYFSSILGLNSNSYENINQTLGKIISECSNLENSYNEFLIKNLTIKWVAYTGNASFEYGNLLPQTLTDFFSDSGLKQVICKWIYDKKTLNSNIDNDKLYLKGYRYFPIKGWSTDEYQIVYPDDYYAYDDFGYRTRKRGLCSSNGTFPNVYYNIKDYIHRLKIELNLSDCDKDIKSSIEYQFKQNWLQKKLEKELYYCDQKWVYYALLDEYIRNVSNGEQEIKKMADDNMEIIRNCYKKDFFIPNVVMREYVKML